MGKDRLSTRGADSIEADRTRRVMHLLPDLAIGGGQTIVLNHLLHADRDRFDVRVTVLHSGGDLLDDFVAATGRSPTLLPFRDDHHWASVMPLVSLLRRERIDLLHVHSDVDRKLGHAAGLLARVPVVGHLHAEWVHLGPMPRARQTGPSRFVSRLNGTLRDVLERRAVRHYVAESVRVRNLFRPLVRQPIAVLDQAIPIDRFHGDGSRPSQFRSAARIGDDTPVLICVSRLVPGKGQRDLVSALPEILAVRPDAILVLVGDGPERGPLEDWARQLDVAHAVRLLGSRRDVPDLLHAANVFVFASENEGFGLAVLEAMAAGLPTVAFRIPSLEEFVVRDKTGVLIDNRDVSAMAAAVLEYLADPVTALEHGRAGREIVKERFAPSRVARSFEAVYDAVLRTPGRPYVEPNGEA